MSTDLLAEYRSTGLDRVEGWGIDADLFDLFVTLNEFQSSHGITGHLCEIGVHHGRTLILLALLSRPAERVVGIDLFEDGQDENLDSSGSGSLSRVKANLAKHAPRIPVDLIPANTFDLTLAQRNLFLGCRMVHIDGGHFREVVLNDIHLVQSSLARGGIVIIDDYWHSLFPEVQEAVHRYFATSSIIKAVPFMTGRNKIFLVHVSHRDRLLHFMRERLPPNRRRPIRLLGYDAICCDLYD